MKRRSRACEQRAEAEALARLCHPRPARALDAGSGAENETAQELQQELENIDRQIAAKTGGRETAARSARLSGAARGDARTRDGALGADARLLDAQKLYSGLLAKNEESKIAANLERRQIGEQFKVLDPAPTAERPFSPNRHADQHGRRRSAGLCFGFGLAAFLEYRDTRFRTQDEVIGAALPVLAQIPLMLTPRERRRTPPAAVSPAAAVPFWLSAGPARSSGGSGALPH